jgi:hypothetical protein
MNCDKIIEIYTKTCLGEVECYKENYNINYPVVEQLHMRNCLLSMSLLAKHCQDHKAKKSKSETPSEKKRYF